MTKETLQQLAREEFESEFGHLDNAYDDTYKDLVKFLDTLIARAFEAVKMHLWSAEGMQIALKEKLDEARAATLTEVKEQIEKLFRDESWEGAEGDPDYRRESIGNNEAIRRALEAINQLTP